jgi:hypothetical protein
MTWLALALTTAPLVYFYLSTKLVSSPVLLAGITVFGLVFFFENSKRKPHNIYLEMVFSIVPICVVLITISSSLKLTEP